MDQGIGRIVETLTKEGMLDDTLILFMADNGACAEIIERGEGGELGGPASFSSYGVGWAWFSNGFLRLFKHWVHGGGVSSPLIVHWPAQIPQTSRGQLRRQPGHLIDIMATSLDVAGAKYPSEFAGNKITPLEGKSLIPAFADKAIEREAIFWEHEGNKAVLVHPWKLVSQHPKGWELYNLDLDRAETRTIWPRANQGACARNVGALAIVGGAEPCVAASALRQGKQEEEKLTRRLCRKTSSSELCTKTQSVKEL